MATQRDLLWMHKALLKCKHQSEFTVLEGLAKEVRTSERGNVSTTGQNQTIRFFELFFNEEVTLLCFSYTAYQNIT